MRFQQFLGALVLFGHETLDFSIDHLTSLGTDLAVVLDRSPQVLELLTCVTHRSELVAHAKFCDHTAGQLSRSHNVVTGPGADRPELHYLGGAPAQHNGDPVLQFVDREQIAVFHRHLHGVAQGATAVRNDADFADRFAMRHQLSHQCVAGLVVGNRGSFLLVHHPALFFGTRSIAASKSFNVTAAALCRAASSAASFMAFAKSAPLKPAVMRAACSTSKSAANFTFLL